LQKQNKARHEEPFEPFYPGHLGSLFRNAPALEGGRYKFSDSQLNRFNHSCLLPEWRRLAQIGLWNNSFDAENESKHSLMQLDSGFLERLG
jgi:hypothetical protein